MKCKITLTFFLMLNLLLGTIHAQYRIINSSEDAGVYQITPDQNFGSVNSSRVTYDTKVNNQKEAYYKFNISEFSTLASSVQLQVYAAQETSNGYQKLTNFYVNIYACTDNSWAENIITWNNKPSIGILLGTINVTNGSPATYYKLQEEALKNYVNNAILAGRDSISFVFKAVNYTDTSEIYMAAKGWKDGAQLIMNFTPKSNHLRSIEDACVFQQYPDSIHGTPSSTRISSTSNNRTKEAYYKFSVKDLPANVSKATLQLYGAQEKNFGYKIRPTFRVSVYGCENNLWNETTLKWNNKPNATSSKLAYSIIDNSGTGKYYNFESKTLTDYINTQINAGKDSVSFIVRADVVDDSSEVYLAAKGWKEGGHLYLDFIPRPKDITVIADASPYKAYPDSLTGKINNMRVTNDTTGGNLKEAFIKFKLPTGKEKASKIQLQIKAGQEGKFKKLDTFALDIYSCTNITWKNDSLNWKNKPTLESKLGSIKVGNHAGSVWYTLTNPELLNFVNSQIAANKDSISFAITGQQITDSSEVYIAGTGWAPPKLLFDYTPIESTLSAYMDASAYQAYPDSITGLINNMRVTKDTISSKGKNEKMAFVKFYLDEINAKTGNVTLQLKTGQEASTGFIVKDTFYLDVFDCSNITWREDSLTWNKKPSVGTTKLASYKVTNHAGSLWYDIKSQSLTDYVNNAILDNKKYITFAVKAQKITDSSEVYIAAKGWAPPKLILNFTPSVTNYNSFEDAGIHQETADINYGNLGTAKVIYDTLNKKTKETYIKFNISSITTRASSVNLQLFGKQDSAFTLLPNFNLNVFKGNDDNWREDSITWNKKPSVATTSLASVNITNGIGTWYDIINTSITDFVNAAILSGDDLITFVIKGASATPGSEVTLSTKESTTKNLAKLVFDFGGAKITGAPVFEIPSGTYINKVIVNLTSETIGASIYYTTDGTTPTTASKLFSKPDTIKTIGNITVKAIAVKTGYTNSAVSICTYSIILPAAGPGFGPGGIGFTDKTRKGQPEMPLWLKADAITGLSDGADVTSWLDLSGNNNNATSSFSGTQPANYYRKIRSTPKYVKNSINGLPAINFGTDTTDLATSSLVVGDNSNLDGNLGIAIAVVLKRNDTTRHKISWEGGDWQSIIEKRENFSFGESPKNSYIIEFGGGENNDDKIKSTINSSSVCDSKNKFKRTDSAYLILLNYDGLANSLMVNGYEETYVNYKKYVSNSSAPLVIGNAVRANIAEVALFNGGLNYAQWTILTEALAAKYGIKLYNKEYDLSLNLDQKKDIIGIGKRYFSDDDKDSLQTHLAASGGGLTLTTPNNTLGADEFVFAGNNGAQITNAASFMRFWQIQKAHTWNDVVTADVTLTFDFAELGLTGQANTSFKLWYKANYASSWENLGITPSLSGEKLSYTVSNIKDGFYSLGTIEPNNIEQLNNLIASLKIYPVPAKNNLTIEFIPTTNSDVTISLHSMLGTVERIIKVENASDKVIKNIDIKDLTAGTYIVRIQEGNNVVKRIITIQ